MPVSWNVHPGLAVNAWSPLSEFAPEVDAETMVATCTIPVLFRGTRSQLLGAFSFGLQNSPQGGAGMFCLGPKSPRQVPYTDRDPHWTAEVSWAGLHSEITGGSSTSAFAQLPEWTTRETAFPIAFTPAVGGTTIYSNYGPPFTPDGDGPAGPWKGRRIDHVPTRTVAGVIYSSTEPTPVHPAIIPLVTAFPTPSSALMTNYAPLLPDPTFVTFAGLGSLAQSAPSSNSPLTAAGEWLCRNFRINRKISQPNSGYSAPALWFISATWSYEQLRQPS